MFEGHSYVALPGEARIQNREIVRVTTAKSNPQPPKPNRTFVPFNGFDGQSLAGKRALVFEGELLGLRN